MNIEASFIDNGKYLKICVEDTGVGINYDDQDKLTELFGFIENKKLINSNGIGLGLVISDQIANKFDGKVTFSSIPEQGSAFQFTF